MSFKVITFKGETHLNEFKDKNYDFLVLEINVHKKYDMLLVNIYGPDNDDPNFFPTASDINSNFQGKFINMAGNFNIV